MRNWQPLISRKCKNRQSVTAHASLCVCRWLCGCVNVDLGRRCSFCKLQVLELSSRVQNRQSYFSFPVFVSWKCIASLSLIHFSLNTVYWDVRCKLLKKSNWNCEEVRIVFLFKDLNHSLTFKAKILWPGTDRSALVICKRGSGSKAHHWLDWIITAVQNNELCALKYFFKRLW